MASASKNFPFRFSLKSEPYMIDIQSFLPGVIERFFIKDSIFDYFPYAELYIIDEGALFTEQRFFTDLLNLDVKFTDTKEKEKINHNFYWSEYQLNDTISPQFVTGFVQMYMLSDFKKQDKVKNKSYYGNISTVVRQIMSAYEYPSNFPDLNISTTANDDVWYQSHEYDYQFIKKLSKYAFSVSSPNSPFFTFINAKGQFNFVDVRTLFNQRVVQNLYYGINEEQGITALNKDRREDVIQSYSFQTLGPATSLDTYNSTYYKLNQSGKYEEDKIKLDTKLNGNRISQNKQTIRKEYLDNVRSIKHFGLVDNQAQEQTYKGWLNNNYIDSVTFPYRLRVDTLFNPKICAGKLVNVEFKSRFETKDYKATEYNGQWLVLECIHSLDKNGNASTNLTLGKSSINVSKKHQFYEDFI